MAQAARQARPASQPTHLVQQPRQDPWYLYQRLPNQQVYCYFPGAQPMAANAISSTLLIPPKPHTTTYPQQLQYSSTIQPSSSSGSRAPRPPPVITKDLPAAHVINSTGGVGVEPGYDYLFPAEHTKMLVLKCPKKPWLLDASQGDSLRFPIHACMVPVRATIAELLRRFGATNPSPKMNQIWEVVQGGNGRWYRGMGIRRDEKDMIPKTCKDMGWDGSRTGLPGGRPAVYLYVMKG
ncbi:hypothetical protein B0H63DRAFT_543877 [Podospora didyma]|uniref:Uncharacterized protein n=1 Tax=Podospora didyma TaxID=330526 RepID=A0AAE0TZX5_9PEZI|nr:hypothetical protein B0H63DRAFT_543877 [Podospora didyma]